MSSVLIDRTMAPTVDSSFSVGMQTETVSPRFASTSAVGSNRR